MGEDIEKKHHIGIANTFFEGSPGTDHLRQLAEAVKKGIWKAGGMPIEFGVPATCGNIATDSDGLRYELVLRDVVAMAIENVTAVHKFDGLVILASCDNIIAGACLAAMRSEIPVIVVTGGPMYQGSCNGQKIVQAEIDVASISGNKEMLEIAEEYGCPSFGACPSMGTANTMQILGEALNLVIPGTATIPAGDNRKLRKSVEAGEFIVSLVKKGVCPSDIVTREVLLNTIMLDMAVAGSTNAVLHILAYGKELGIPVSLADFDKLAREIKCIVGVIPSGIYSVVDFYEAGGPLATMKQIQKKLYLAEETLLGISWGQLLQMKEIKVRNQEVIRSLDNPVDSSPGMRILTGNLSPFGAVCRPTGFPKNMRSFRGKARCFNKEEEAAIAIMRDEILPGDVVVIRYEGCKGSPGMNELMKATDRLLAKNLQDKVALIADGRFSGFNHGSIIGYVSPEAYRGGLIAFVEDGDSISYDLEKGTLTLEVEESIIAKRKKNWSRPPQKITKGVLAIYGATCCPPEEGGPCSRGKTCIKKTGKSP